MYDYDACLLYHAGDAAIVDSIAARLITDTRLTLARWSNEHEPASSDLAMVRQLLPRSATAVLFVSDKSPSPWSIPELKQTLQQRAITHDIRLIIVHLTEAPDPGFSVSTTLDYRLDSKAAFEGLEAAIVGYRQAALTYPALPDVPATAQSASSVSGVFLPSQVFEPRPEEEAMRAFWQDKARNGVLALVGTGGSGKTTLLTHFLHELSGTPLSGPAHTARSDLPAPSRVFVWSIYDNPNIEYFIRGLYEYLTGQTTLDPARDVVYRLIGHLEHSHIPDLLIALDGLELVQEAADSSVGAGLLRDSSLRHFVRRIARGDLPVKLVMTSRLSLPELTPFVGVGYWLIETDHLNDAAARHYLRSQRIIGTDADLDSLLQAFGHHMLTLDQLARLLREHFAGDPKAALTLPEHPVSLPEPQAQRLARIFAFYEKHLTADELIVLRVLSLLRSPISYSILAAFFNSERSVEALAELPILNDADLRALLARLQARGLIAFYGTSAAAVCTTHPAVRDFFAYSLDLKQRQVHARVGEVLLSLIDHPKNTRNVINPRLLDIYEETIYHFARRGEDSIQHMIRGHSAHGLYEQLGNYQHFAWRLADYGRGLRLAQLLIGAPSAEHWLSFRTTPWYDYNLFLLDSGQPAAVEHNMRELLDRLQYLVTLQDEQLMPAEHYTEPTFVHVLKNDFGMYEGIVVQSLCDALLAQGKLVPARDLMDNALNSGKDWTVRGNAMEAHTGSNPYARRALALADLGEVDGALTDFQAADQFARDHVHWVWPFNKVGTDWYHKPFHAVLLARLGLLREARRLLEQFDEVNLRTYRPMAAAQYDLAAGEIAYRAGDIAAVPAHAEKALGWAMQAGHQQVLTQALIMQARTLPPAQAFSAADSALSQAVDVARTCGFTLLLVDALVLAGHSALEQHDAHTAEGWASEALSSSQDTLYRWGIGDAAYLLAKCAFRQQHYSKAMTYAVQALDVRQFIRDPRQHYTAALMQDITQHLA